MALGLDSGSIIANIAYLSPYMKKVHFLSFSSHKEYLWRWASLASLRLLDVLTFSTSEIHSIHFQK